MRRCVFRIPCRRVIYMKFCFLPSFPSLRKRDKSSASFHPIRKIPLFPIDKRKAEWSSWGTSIPLAFCSTECRTKMPGKACKDSWGQLIFLQKCKRRPSEPPFLILLSRNGQCLPTCPRRTADHDSRGPGADPVCLSTRLFAGVSTCFAR